MNTEKKQEWIKPELIIICESEINENLLGSTIGRDSFDRDGDDQNSSQY